MNPESVTMTAVQWVTVLAVSVCFLATSSGHSLHNGARHKSGGTGPHQPLNPKYLNRNFVGSSHSVDVGNIGGGFKSKRDEDRSDISAEDEPIDGISDDDVYYYDNDGDGEDDDNDEYYRDDKDYSENESDSDDNYENKAADKDNTDGYLYDYMNDNGISDENDNENEADKARFSRVRKEVFGTKKNSNIPVYKDDVGPRDQNYRKDDDEDQDDGEDNDDNIEEDDQNGVDAEDGQGDSENNYDRSDGDVEDDDDEGDSEDDDEGDSEEDDDDDDDEHSSAWDDDNGSKVVADYIVDHIQSVSSGEQNGNRRCLFGWRLDASGLCAPSRKKCAPGLVRSKTGDCVAADGGHWYK